MTKRISTFLALGLVLVASVAGHRALAGIIRTTPANALQTTLTGEWTASLSDNDSRINLNFERRTEKDHHNTFGQTYDFAELGLSREQVMNGGPVRFSLAREAGTTLRVCCEV